MNFLLKEVRHIKVIIWSMFRYGRRIKAILIGSFSKMYNVGSKSQVVFVSSSADCFLEKNSAWKCSSNTLRAKWPLSAKFLTFAKGHLKIKFRQKFTKLCWLGLNRTDSYLEVPADFVFIDDRIFVDMFITAKEECLGQYQEGSRWTST